MGNNTHEAEAASCRTEMFGLRNCTEDAVRIYVFNRADEIAERWMTAARAVAYVCIAPVEGNLIHDDIYR